MGMAGVPVVAQREQTQLRSMRSQVPSLVSLRGLRIRRCRELWWRPAAVALIRPLGWEPPHAAGAALKPQKERKKGREEGRKGGRNGNRWPPPPQEYSATLNRVPRTRWPSGAAPSMRSPGGHRTFGVR